VPQPKTKHMQYPKVDFNPYAINIIPRIRPWVAAAWSAAFPGFGHFYLGDYLRGYIFIIWEIGINIYSHLNEAIMYTFTGRFAQAREVFDLRLGALYMIIYIFCIWDTYNIAVDYNKLSLLAEREAFRSVAVKVNPLTVNYLGKKSPAAAAFWSALIPGLGQIYCRHLPSGVFKAALWVFVTHHCKLAAALNCLLRGEFAAAQTDPLWFLFLPSLYCFAIGSAYQYATYNNRAMEAAKMEYLRRRYPWQNFGETP